MFSSWPIGAAHCRLPFKNVRAAKPKSLKFCCASVRRRHLFELQPGFFRHVSMLASSADLNRFFKSSLCVTCYMYLVSSLRIDISKGSISSASFLSIFSLLEHTGFGCAKSVTSYAYPFFT